MREITNHEKKLIDIMEKYGDVYTYEDDTDECAILGNIHTNGIAWAHTSDGNRLDVSPIQETYLALKDVVLNMVNIIQDR